MQEKYFLDRTKKFYLDKTREIRLQETEKWYSLYVHWYCISSWVSKEKINKINNIEKALDEIEEAFEEWEKSSRKEWFDNALEKFHEILERYNNKNDDEVIDFDKEDNNFDDEYDNENDDDEIVEFSEKEIKKFNIVAKLRIMPKGIDVDLKKMEKDIKEILSKSRSSKFHSAEIRPIAFGLSALETVILITEADSELEGIEDKISNSIEISYIGMINIDPELLKTGMLAS